MNELLKSEKFMKGLYLGINISLQMILKAQERNELLTIDDEQFYILSGDKLLQQMLDFICDG